MNFTFCVRVCGVEGCGKSLPRQFSFVCEKDNPEESSTKSLGCTTQPMTKWDLKFDDVTTPASPGPVLTGRTVVVAIDRESSLARRSSSDRSCA